jgi:hypothetical protein
VGPGIGLLLLLLLLPPAREIGTNLIHACPWSMRASVCGPIPSSRCVRSCVSVGDKGFIGPHCAVAEAGWFENIGGLI